ncbi:Phage tail protein [Macrococcoides canis]|uniref:Phage tail protein n=1 Tax=Macrococcoides canis TaxID=1855823 RepID=A0A1W7ACF8_9STAP|nr:phage tail domain-containing protein [Macrococcus canis]ARQ07282.1 Phage tail protein [Macrococcus canis]
MNYIDAEIVKGTKKYKISNNELTGTSLEVLSFVIGKVKKRNYFSSIDGRIGRVNYGIEDEYRTIKLRLRASAYDEHDIAHLRDEIFNLFDGEFYIREMRNNVTTVKYETIGSNTNDMNLGNSEYVNGKRYLVALVSDFDIADMQYSEFDLEFETVMLPYAETVYTSMHLHRTKYNEEEAIYGLVDGLNTDYQDYVFTTNTFKVWNAGNVDLRPENMDILITINGLSSNGNFTLKNKTTGDVFIYKNSAYGTLKINGLTISLNNINVLRNTNYEFIGIAKGLNEFEVLNGTFSSISFDFRFYYK